MYKTKEIDCLIEKGVSMNLFETILALTLGVFLVGCNGTTLDIAKKTPEELKEANYTELVKAHKHCRKNKRKTQERDKLYAELRRRDELAMQKNDSLEDFILIEDSILRKMYNNRSPASYYTMTIENVRDARRKWYVNNNKISDKTKQLILEGRFATGWPKEHLHASIGKPYDINRTVSSKNVHEQWLYYSGYYIYFENGILTSWQD